MVKQRTGGTQLYVVGVDANGKYVNLVCHCVIRHYRHSSFLPAEALREGGRYYPH